MNSNNCPTCKWIGSIQFGVITFQHSRASFMPDSGHLGPRACLDVV